MSNKQIVVRVPAQAVGLGALLTALFVVLKLTGYIFWGWFWVFAPLWIPFAVALLGLSLGLMGMGFITFLAWVFHK